VEAASVGVVAEAIDESARNFYLHHESNFPPSTLASCSLAAYHWQALQLVFCLGGRDSGPSGEVTVSHLYSPTGISRFLRKPSTSA
jgi:hypothetical protein